MASCFAWAGSMVWADLPMLDQSRGNNSTLVRAAQVESKSEVQLLSRIAHLNVQQLADEVYPLVSLHAQDALQELVFLDF